MGYRAYRTPGLAAVTGQPRYRELARRYGPVVAQAGTCACHVHVGVPSRDLGVQAGRHRRRTIRCFKAGTHASHIRPIFGKYYGDPYLAARRSYRSSGPISLNTSLHQLA